MSSSQEPIKDHVRKGSQAHAEENRFWHVYTREASDSIFILHCGGTNYRKFRNINHNHFNLTISGSQNTCACSRGLGLQDRTHAVGGVVNSPPDMFRLSVGFSFLEL